ncbi:hypothetical protein B0H17DRAFT_1078277, partial [Mycena rosella]
MSRDTIRPPRYCTTHGCDRPGAGLSCPRIRKKKSHRVCYSPFPLRAHTDFLRDILICRRGAV